MTKRQEQAIERFRKCVIEHDCYNGDPGYEIKEFEISELGVGGIIVISCMSGMKDDDGTYAAIYCRKYRNVFVGPRGGISATGQHPVTNKERKCQGWSDVIIFGYRS